MCEMCWYTSNVGKKMTTKSFKSFFCKQFKLQVSNTIKPLTFYNIPIIEYSQPCVMLIG